MSKSAAPRLITLGTAGGPRWWRYGRQKLRSGVSTAVVVGEAAYLVDCGYGAGRQLVQAGFGLDDVTAIFVTHLHSDHIADLASIAMFSTFEITKEGHEPITLIGPGDRGVLPLVSPHATVAPSPVSQESPTPGTRDTFRRLVEANATDLNERILDSLRPSPLDMFKATDIELPNWVDFDPNLRPAPTMSPFEVYEDSRVRVSAILVEHPPMAPAFAYRFDTDEGSAVVSGDTAFTPNMITLAQGADLLLHEAIDLEWLLAKFPDPTSEQARAIRSHHERSHTSVIDAVEVARSANVKTLGLHHLVPGTSGPSLQRQLDGVTDLSVEIPDDLTVFSMCQPG